MSSTGSRTRPFSSRRHDLALHLGDFFLELFEDLGRVYRVDEDGDVEHVVEVDDRREPPVGKDARIGHDKKRARDFVAEVDLARRDLERRGAMTS